MQDDPVKFALKDRKSLACGGAITLIVVAARFSPGWFTSVLH